MIYIPRNRDVIHYQHGYLNGRHDGLVEGYRMSGGMMTKYVRGTRYEREAKSELEQLGFYVVRSAGSHGCIDLVALHDTGISLIQVKSVKGKSVPFKSWKKELLDMCFVPLPLGGTLLLWVWRDRKGFDKFRVFASLDFKKVTLVNLRDGSEMVL